jgi:hypothetical protein
MTRTIGQAFLLNKMPTAVFFAATYYPSFHLIKLFLKQALGQGVGMTITTSFWL